MKLARTIAAPVAAVAIIAGSTVAMAGTASAAPPIPENLNVEGFAEQLGINTTIGGFAGTALGAGVGCALGAAGVGSATGPTGSIAGCTVGASFGGLIGTLIGGSFALPTLFEPVE